MWRPSLRRWASDKDWEWNSEKKSEREWARNKMNCVRAITTNNPKLMCHQKNAIDMRIDTWKNKPNCVYIWIIDLGTSMSWRLNSNARMFLETSRRLSVILNLCQVQIKIRFFFCCCSFFFSSLFYHSHFAYYFISSRLGGGGADYDIWVYVLMFLLHNTLPYNSQHTHPWLRSKTRTSHFFRQFLGIQKKSVAIIEKSVRHRLNW